MGSCASWACPHARMSARVLHVVCKHVVVGCFALHAYTTHWSDTAWLGGTGEGPHRAPVNGDGVLAVCGPAGAADGDFAVQTLPGALKPPQLHLLVCARGRRETESKEGGSGRVGVDGGDSRLSLA